MRMNFLKKIRWNRHKYCSIKIPPQFFNYGGIVCEVNRVVDWKLEG